MGDARHHMGVGHDQAGSDHEPRALLDLTAPVTDDLDRRRSGSIHGLLEFGVAGQGDRTGGRRGQLGEDRGEPFGGQEALNPRKDGRRCGQHRVECPDDLRLIDRRVEGERGGARQGAGQQPGDQQGGDDRHHYAQSGVELAGDPPVHPVEGQIAEHPTDRPTHGRHADQGDQRHRHRGRLGVHPTDGDRGQGGTEVEADQEAAERQHLHDGPQPQPLNGRDDHHHDDDDVDHVHRRVPAAEVTGTSGHGGPAPSSYGRRTTPEPAVMTRLAAGGVARSGAQSVRPPARADRRTS